METKKYISYSWPTLLLCFSVSFSQSMLATAASFPSSKDTSPKSKRYTSQPDQHSSSRKSSPEASQANTRKATKKNKNQQAKRPQRHTSKPPSTATATTSQKLSKNCCEFSLANKGKNRHGEKSFVQPKKSMPLSLTKDQRKKEALITPKVLPHAPQQRAEQLQPTKSSKILVSHPDRSKRRYISVLKETKQQRMEKVLVEIPRTRSVVQKSGVGPKIHQTAHIRTNRKNLNSATTSQSIRVPHMRATSAQPASPVVPEAAESTSTEAKALPVTSSSRLLTPAAGDTTQNVASQLPLSTLNKIEKEAPSADVVTLPSSPPQTTSPARVESSNPQTIATKAKEQPQEWSGYSPQKAPFSATANDEPLRYRINSLFVLPGDEIFLAVVDSQKRAEYSVRSTLGPERLLASRRWYWTAPTTAGAYQLKVANTQTNTNITLNVFVMVPLDRIDRDGYLNGYRIGIYPTEPLRQLAMYNRPRGLIEVTPENENSLVSPHFRLRQFLCKQDGGYPKYMILDARLLTTLEQLLEMVNARGYQARTFSIMSGYRTPYYNRAIGNRTTYSRHLWGDAADIYIDEEPRDGRMDDLNEDGVIDAHDVDVIYQMIENTSEPRIQKIMLGGLARYRETSSHGPFIHVDARGSYVRWGLKTLTNGGTTRNEMPFPARDNPPYPSFWQTGTSQPDLR